jgi:FKBP-type peptidyl-prolyl cis-trans isomerase
LISVKIVRQGIEAENFVTDNKAFLERYQTARTIELNLLSQTEPEVASFIGSLDSYSKTMSGIYYSVVYEGFGETPTMGQTATVHYTGQLPDERFLTPQWRGDNPFP